MISSFVCGVRVSVYAFTPVHMRACDRCALSTIKGMLVEEAQQARDFDAGDLVHRQTDRQTDRHIDRSIDR